MRRLILLPLVAAVLLGGCESEHRICHTTDLVWDDCKSEKLGEGGRYVGELMDGKPHGQGTRVDPEGWRYVGEWRDGKENGHGRLYKEASDCCCYYSGEWEKGDFHEGTRDCPSENYPDGAKYTGQFKDGQPHGRGISYFGNGNIKYVGEFKDGQPSGQGTAFNRQGGIAGKWCDVENSYWTDCVGERTIETENYKFDYSGHWRNNAPHGQGAAMFEHGKRYIGEWSDGKQNGQGSFDNLFEVFQSRWQDGELQRGGTYATEMVTKYVGEFKNGHFNGQGTYYREDSSLFYRGEFKDGTRHGQGTLYHGDGSIVYQGEWCNGKEGPCG